MSAWNTAKVVGPWMAGLLLVGTDAASADEVGEPAPVDAEPAADGTAEAPPPEPAPAPPGRVEAWFNASPFAPPSPAERHFVKGTLAHVGDVDFYVPRQQVWVGSQYFYTTDRLDDGRIHRTHYMGVVPRISLHRRDLWASFEVPLAFEVYDYISDPTNPSAVPGGEEFAGAGTFAGFLWDEPSDYAQVIRYLRYGSKEDPLYLDVSRVAAATIGHGTVMRSYNANLDLDRRWVGAQLDYAHDYGGVELHTNNVVGWNILSVLGFVRPGAYLKPENLYARSASLGLSLSVDRKAPFTLATDANDHLVADAVSLPEVAQAMAVPIMGVDGEVKVLKTKHLDVKTYGDLSRLMVDGGDAGWSMGALGRFNLGEKDGRARHAFRARAEMQLYGAHYDPGYFDLFYEVQKYQANLDAGAPRQTKLVYLLEREPGLEVGTRIEGSYALVNRAAVAASLETNSAGDNLALFHLELPAGERLRLMGTAAKVGFDGLGGLFDTTEPNTLLMARAQLRPVKWMMIGAEYSQLYGMTALSGEARPPEGQPGLYGPASRWSMDLSVGYEF